MDFRYAEEQPVERREVVALERHEHACVVRLQRPAKLNAISEQVERELCDALQTAAVREAPCVVFTGGEKVFSAGADLSETRGYAADEVLATYRATGDFAERVADLAQPTISAIAGYCIGGGLELALATDFRIAEESADFRFPEVALGILPSWGGTQRAVRLLGPAQAKELILLRERVDARAALSLGLVTEVVNAGRALPRALELAGRLSALPRLAVAVTKQVIDALPETSRSAGLGLERVAYGLLAQTAEATQALTRRHAS
ncbi:MAG TPA: enoyl-CoA hydratase/isomerase family protein [Solirubrobacteraceae bacterium]|nr:enoyl-CoA hydratase/isomerase family protein [Solirubrobacteraceae bacterium]